MFVVGDLVKNVVPFKIYTWRNTMPQGVQRIGVRKILEEKYPYSFFEIPANTLFVISRWQCSLRCLAGEGSGFLLYSNKNGSTSYLWKQSRIHLTFSYGAAPKNTVMKAFVSEAEAGRVASAVLKYIYPTEGTHAWKNSSKLTQLTSLQYLQFWKERNVRGM